MYKNYKCKVNYDLLSCMPDTASFVRLLAAKDPLARPTAAEALTSDTFARIELDEHQFSSQNLLVMLDQLNSA